MSANGQRYNVGGIMLERPFKIVRLGPLRFFVPDIDAATAFYRDMLGLTPTEEVLFEGNATVQMGTSETNLERANELILDLMSEDLDAATAGHRVGYESPSQFSREYSRFFGVPPATDMKRLRSAPQAGMPA